jgi:hypothetical protein
MTNPRRIKGFAVWENGHIRSDSTWPMIYIQTIKPEVWRDEEQKKVIPVIITFPSPKKPKVIARKKIKK